MSATEKETFDKLINWKDVIRAAIFTIIPILLGIGLLLYTSYRIAQLRSELERTQSELDEARTFLREAVNLSRWVVPLDMMDEKSLHRLDSRTAELFETIMHERHI